MVPSEVNKNYVIQVKLYNPYTVVVVQINMFTILLIPLNYTNPIKLSLCQPNLQQLNPSYKV